MVLAPLLPGQAQPSLCSACPLFKKERETDRQTGGPQGPPLTDEQLHDVGARVLPHVLDPVRHGQERAPLGDVVRQDGPVGAAVVALGDGAEALLASRVPDLQLKKQGSREPGGAAERRGRGGRAPRPTPKALRPGAGHRPHLGMHHVGWARRWTERRGLLSPRKATRRPEQDGGSKGEAGSPVSTSRVPGQGGGFCTVAGSTLDPESSLPGTPGSLLAPCPVPAPLGRECPLPPPSGGPQHSASLFCLSGAGEDAHAGQGRPGEAPLRRPLPSADTAC